MMPARTSLYAWAPSQWREKHGPMVALGLPAEPTGQILELLTRRERVPHRW